MEVEGNLFVRPLRVVHARLKQRPFLILISKWEGKRLESRPSGLSPLMLQVAWSLVGVTASSSLQIYWIGTRMKGQRATDFSHLILKLSLLLTL
jgi:hypothetical protein